MAFKWTWKRTRHPLYVSLHGGALTLNLNEQVNLTFDGEGRLVGAWMDRVRYRRALDNRVLSKRVDPERPWRRVFRFLPPRERDQVLARAYDLAGDVARGLDRGDLDVGPTDEATLAEVRDWLARVGTWTLARLERERERFLRVYKPVSILPPDQYLAVVLQATEGCSYNLCTFCTFYRDRPFRIKPLPEFAAHVQGVKALLGRGRFMRRHIFLADANAVIIAQKLLLPVMEHVRQAFPMCPEREEGWCLDGMYAFISAPDALRKRAEDFAAMKRLGMKRLYVGLETGHDPLRAFLLKPGTTADVLTAVRTMKEGGLSVGVIFMVGVGGEQFRAAHFRDTVAAVKNMPLSAGDIVYVSPFVASPDAPYTRDAADAGIKPMSDEEIWREVQAFRQALRPWARAREVKVSYYDIREFVY